jgi:2-isopropylmalate synthase
MFTVESFKMTVEKNASGMVSEAIVKIRVGDQLVYTVAEGNGPVNALDNALRKALMDFYPDIRNVHLTDYKVRVLDEKDATAAKVRVLIESTDFKESWSTVGVSSNVIEASWEALVDSIRYALLDMTKKDAAPAAAAQIESLGIVNF